MSKPNVKVSEETWRELNARKRPGDTFDDVIKRLLDDYDADSAPGTRAEG